MPFLAALPALGTGLASLAGATIPTALTTAFTVLPAVAGIAKGIASGDPLGAGLSALGGLGGGLLSALGSGAGSAAGAAADAGRFSLDTGASTAANLGSNLAPDLLMAQNALTNTLGTAPTSLSLPASSFSLADVPTASDFAGEFVSPAAASSLRSNIGSAAPSGMSTAEKAANIIQGITTLGTTGLDIYRSLQGNKGGGGGGIDLSNPRTGLEATTQRAVGNLPTIPTISQLAGAQSPELELGQFDENNELLKILGAYV